MSLFEEIKPELIESAEIEDLPKSSRNFKEDDSLTVSYSPSMKALILLSPVAFAPFFQIVLDENFFFLEIFLVGLLVVCLWVMADSLQTLSFTLSPDKIVKKSLFSQSEIPTSALILHVKDQEAIFYHGSATNLRETMQIRRFFISGADYADIAKYAHDIYRVLPNKPAPSGASQLAVREYDKSASSYRLMASFLVILPLLAVFTVGLSDSFFGVAPSLPAYSIRLASIALAAGSFFLLRKWSRDSLQISHFAVSPVMTRLEQADVYAFRSAALAIGVASLGLVLFLLFGNTLDLYVFLLVGGLYFYDSYPRFSTWELLTAKSPEPQIDHQVRAILPRRSLQISLVLMGTLAVTSYGESNNYLYANRKDCQDDWGDGKDCRELSGGSGSGGRVHYYGPRYGSSVGRPTRAVGVGTISRGGFGSLGGFHASFGG
jgi:hypothetical protein